MVDLLDDEMRQWAELGPELAESLAALRDLVLAGGKRLRPCFFHLAFVGAGGAPGDPSALDLAAALELVHTFALVHDDVMDGSDQRRGADAVHQRFIRRHHTFEWHGEARRFGEGMAILVGDFALVYADRLARGASDVVNDIFDQLRIELCIGQSLDLVGAARPGSDLDEARTVTRFKSARYTVERPLHLGAAHAGRLDDLAVALSAVGRPLGEAFQLRDDVLGVFGDPIATGKPVGADLREGKATPLLALALRRASPEGQSLLGRLGAHTTASEIASAMELLESTGARDEVEREIARLEAQARRAIDELPLANDTRRDLGDLAAYVAWRDR